MVLNPLLSGYVRILHKKSLNLYCPRSQLVQLHHVKSGTQIIERILFIIYCEAQARVRQGKARDGSQGERPQSFKPCQELTLKLVARQCPGEVGGGKGRCVGSLWVTSG